MLVVCVFRKLLSKAEWAYSSALATFSLWEKNKNTEFWTNNLFCYWHKHASSNRLVHWCVDCLLFICKFKTFLGFYPIVKMEASAYRNVLKNIKHLQYILKKGNNSVSIKVVQDESFLIYICLTNISSWMFISLSPSLSSSLSLSSASSACSSSLTSSYSPFLCGCFSNILYVALSSETSGSDSGSALCQPCF